MSDSDGLSSGVPCSVYVASCVFSFLTFLCELGMILFYIVVRLKRQSKLFRRILGVSSAGYFLFDAVFWLTHFFIGSCYCYKSGDTYIGTDLNVGDYCSKTFSWTQILIFVIDVCGCCASFTLFLQKTKLTLIYVIILFAQVVGLWLVHYSYEFVDPRILNPSVNYNRYTTHLFDASFQFRNAGNSKKEDCVKDIFNADKCFYGFSDSKKDQRKIAHFYPPNSLDGLGLSTGKFTHIQVFTYVFVQFIIPNLVAFCSSFVIFSGSGYVSL